MSTRGPVALLAVAGMILLVGCTSGSGAHTTKPSGSAAATSTHSTTASPPTSSLASSSAPTPSSATSSASATSTSGVALQQDFVDVVKHVLPSVVEITTSKALGSGIVFDTKGDIVTNDHVVGNATHFSVRLAGSGSAYTATLAGAYPPDDLAVIRLQKPPASLHPAHFGNSSTLQVGDLVLAMGNPLGLSGSVTNGIVSAAGRTVNEPQGGDSPGATLPDVIQTSAAINPGNSGGALVDLAGDVVGIPTLAAIDKQIGGGSAAPGLGFAIPSNTVTDIAGQIIAHGKVVHSHRAALGITATTVLDQTGAPAGVAVQQVIPGGPAAKAGIRTGEVITALASTPVYNTQQLSDLLAHLTPGQTVKVTTTTPTGTTHTTTVTVGQLTG